MLKPFSILLLFINIFLWTHGTDARSFSLSSDPLNLLDNKANLEIGLGLGEHSEFFVGGYTYKNAASASANRNIDWNLGLNLFTSGIERNSIYFRINTLVGTYDKDETVFSRTTVTLSLGYQWINKSGIHLKLGVVPLYLDRDGGLHLEDFNTENEESRILPSFVEFRAGIYI